MTLLRSGIIGLSEVISAARAEPAGPEQGPLAIDRMSR